MRLFVAINLPEKWKAVLGQPQEAIGWLGRGVRWVEPEGIHLTLKFLGDTEESRLPELNTALTNACSVFPQLALQIRGTGVFPSPNKPRIYWAGLKYPEQLAELQQAVDSATEALGFPAEERAFRPHLTLARIKEPIGKQRITDAFLSYKLRSDPFTADHVSLMRSHLSREGAAYEELASYPLALHN